MKTPFLSILALLLAATLARADWVVVQKTDTAGQAIEVTTKIKGDLARVDQGDKMTVIVGAEGMTMLMHAQKMLMKMDLATMKAAIMVLECPGSNPCKAPSKMAVGIKTQKLLPPCWMSSEMGSIRGV